jgi:flagellar motor switch protein FliN
LGGVVGGMSAGPGRKSLGRPGKHGSDRTLPALLQEAPSRVSDEAKPSRQDEVEQLLSEARQGGTPPAAPAEEPAPAAPAAAAPPDDAGGPLDQAAIEALLNQSAGKAPPRKHKPAAAAGGGMEQLLDGAERALASLDDPTAALPAGVKPFELRNLTGKSASADAATLDLLRDVQLDLKIELGRTHMQLEEVLQLKKGAVVTLDKLAGDPVDIFVNGRLIARGEVLVLNDNFCVRVAELVAGEAVRA